MEDCIFCKLARGEIPTDMVHYEDDLISIFQLMLLKRHACFDGSQKHVYLLMI